MGLERGWGVWVALGVCGGTGGDTAGMQSLPSVGYRSLDWLRPALLSGLVLLLGQVW